nr:3-oxoacyl-[acyl-carrier-protein] synthase, mitochondrial [Ipomoea batatas]
MTRGNWFRFVPSRLQLRRYCSSDAFDPPPFFPPRRAVVTGVGMVTPLGCGVKTTWERLIQGECGVRAITLDDLKMNGFDEEVKLRAFDQLTSKVAAIVPCGTSPGEFQEELWLNSKEHRSIARFIGYALCAADEALKDANWIPTTLDEKERTNSRRISPFFIPRILINMASGHVSMKYGFQGPNHAAVTACATGAHSVGDATRMIQFGDADVMVAGGTEASIDALSIAGFCRSRALTTKYNAAPQEASRPFDCDRDGFVIGEGSGILVLEELEHAKKRGAKIYAEVRGYGTSGDAYHITQPHLSGRGAILAMTRALKQVNIPHFSGDAVEATAIKHVFSDHATSGALAFSSTKGAVGHLLGAAGAVEAIFAILALNHGMAPLTLNLKKPDPIFTGDFTPLTASKQIDAKVALSNSFGFGGTNATLLFASIN